MCTADTYIVGQGIYIEVRILHVGIDRPHDAFHQGIIIAFYLDVFHFVFLLGGTTELTAQPAHIVYQVVYLNMQFLHTEGLGNVGIGSAFKSLQQEDKVENIEVKGNNDALMERIMRSVNAHMKDTDFNVDALADDVGISRAQLHRKMKEITGISSGKFLRNLRMEQAARLLREGRVNVTQVADSVGYNDQAHFSTAFKNHFGMSPSEYVAAHKEEDS